MPAPRVRVQVVHDVAAADDQHAGVAQRPQALPDLVVKMRRARLVDAELYDRYIGFRKNMAEHRPRPVIETPAVVELDVERRQQLLHLACERRVAGRGILDGEQLARKAAEIVNRPRLRHRRHGELRDVPVRRNAQHRARPRQARAERRPGLAYSLFPSAFMGLP